MPPSTYHPIGTVQQTIVSLLNANEPFFIDIGVRLLTSFAAILIAWCLGVLQQKGTKYSNSWRVTTETLRQHVPQHQNV